jgi:Uma2 family endonuclease
MAVQLTRRRFTVDDYYAMARVGILHEDDRVELIDGEIVEMPPIGPGHSGAVIGLTRVLMRAFGDHADVSVQNPVRLNVHNEPEPDVSLLRQQPDTYRAAHPTPVDILLVIEVADTSLAADQRVKMPMYARAGLPEAWIIDLQHDLVLVHRDPGPDGYRLVTTARRGERLAPLAFPNRELTIDELLG